MSRHAQKLLVIATPLLPGAALLVTHAIEIAGQDATRADHEALASRYEQEASPAQATVKGGLINRLNYLVRKYQAVAEQNLALAKSHRVGVVDNSNQTSGAKTRHR